MEKLKLMGDDQFPVIKLMAALGISGNVSEYTVDSLLDIVRRRSQDKAEPITPGMSS